MRSEFENAFKKAYPHADTYLACLKFVEAENQYKPIDEKIDFPNPIFWICVGVNTGWWAYQSRQTEVDELQRRNKMLNDNVKEQGQKLVYQNGVIETQAGNLLGLRDEKAELQKRVDKTLQLLEENSIEFYEAFETGKNSRIVDADELEQALKGDHE